MYKLVTYLSDSNGSYNKHTCQITCAKVEGEGYAPQSLPQFNANLASICHFLFVKNEASKLSLGLINVMLCADGMSSSNSVTSEPLPFMLFV
jgi:hypothetical protein